MSGFDITKYQYELGDELSIRKTHSLGSGGCIHFVNATDTPIPALSLPLPFSFSASLPR